MTTDELKAYISQTFGDQMTLLETGRGEPWYVIDPSDLLDIAGALRDDDKLKFDYLCNMHAVDTGEQFEVVYNIASIPNKMRLSFKFTMPYDGAAVESIQSIWPAANWHEREMWELFGIDIRNHGNLTRFLLPDDWDQGYPMRKDWDAPDFIRLPEFEA